MLSRSAPEEARAAEQARIGERNINSAQRKGLGWPYSLSAMPIKL